MVRNFTKKVLFVFGTRPEAIKVAPIIIKAKQSNILSPIVCITGQHKEMLDQVLNFFQIRPDYNLELMEPNQDLYDVTIKGLGRIKLVIEETKPDLILIQGDTTTSFIGSLAGYYSKIKVGHIEAGLRSGDKYSPYPEEIMRILNGHIANIHFAPTSNAVKKLAKESIVKNVHMTGNSVIDSLLLGLDIIKNSGEKYYFGRFNFIDFTKKIILVTAHRRESFGAPLENIYRALVDLARKYKNDVQIIYPIHLNPKVKKIAQEKLSNIDNIFLTEPLDYNEMIWLMSKSYMIITDSGGLQEEAPSIGKPVLVIRDVTERIEGIEAGTSKLVGTDYNKIYTEAEKLIKDQNLYRSMAQATNPYGNGKTSQYIVEILENYLS